MKVIDLLVKIANKEELPKKIKYNQNIFLSGNSRAYLTEDGEINLLGNLYYVESLNEEIEIIEENIMPLEIKSDFSETQNGMTKMDRKKLDNNFRAIDLILKGILDKVNELEREMNK